MIHVIATIELNAGTRGSFLGEFKKLVPLVQAEKGCLEYGPAVDAENAAPDQPPPRANTVVVIEKWSDLAALAAHRNAQHMVDFRPKVKDYVKSIQLQILAPA